MRRLVQSEDLGAAVPGNSCDYIGNRSNHRSGHNGLDNNGSHEHSQDHVEPATVQLNPFRVLPLRDGGGSVLRGRTVLISSPILRNMRPRLYPSHSLNVRPSLSTSRRWRSDDHTVHAHTCTDRES
jgi:hypothetical protein